MDANTIKAINDLYGLQQSLNFYKRKYSEKLNVEELKSFLNDKGVLEKFDYLFNKKKEEVRFFELMESLKFEDAEDFFKYFVLYQNTGNKNIQKDKILKKIEEYKKDFDDISSILKEISKYEDDKELKITIQIVKKQMLDLLKSDLREGEEKIDEDELEQMLFGGEENKEKESIGNLEKLSDMLSFFQKIRKLYKKFGYILTPREMVMVDNILGDLNNQKVVTLLGETGTGKTELARFVCKAFLNKEPVFVAGSKYLTEEDFTLKRTITSKSLLEDNKITTGEDKGLTEEQYLEKIATKTMKKLLQEKKFKQILQGKGFSQDEIDKMDISGYHLFTENYLVGIFKAAVEGRPLIIDEANAIKPDVFIALNDYIQKKVGDEVELEDGLGKVKFKEGFSIILTGNDTYATGSNRYKQGRYEFDEATYNRLSTYTKDYYKQIGNQNFRDSVSKNDYIEHINDNELYSIILMMLFDHKNNPYGVQLEKEDLVEIDTLAEKKSKVLGDLKKLARGISLIQKAFLGEAITLSKINSDISVHNEINRKVFTMRNLNDVLKTYLNGTDSLEQCLYENFIMHEGKKEERYAILALFYEVGFFDYLVGDDMNQTLENLEKMYLEGKMKDKGKTKLSNTLKAQTSDKKTGVVLINKYDLMNEMFGGNLKLEISEKDENIIESLSKEINPNDETKEEQEVENVSLEDLESLVDVFGMNVNKLRTFLIEQRVQKFRELENQEEYKDIANKLRKEEMLLKEMRKKGQDTSEQEKKVQKLKEIFDNYLKEINKINKEYKENGETIFSILMYLQQGGKDDLNQEEINKIYRCIYGIIESVLVS